MYQKNEIIADAWDEYEACIDKSVRHLALSNTSNRFTTHSLYTYMLITTLSQQLVSNDSLWSFRERDSIGEVRRVHST